MAETGPQQFGAPKKHETILEEVLHRSHNNLFSYSALKSQLDIQDQLNRTARMQENLAFAIEKECHPELKGIKEKDEGEGMSIVNFGVIAGTEEIKELTRPKGQQSGSSPDQSSSNPPPTDQNPPEQPTPDQKSSISRLPITAMTIAAVVGSVALASMAISSVQDDDDGIQTLYDIEAEPYESEHDVPTPTPISSSTQTER